MYAVVMLMNMSSIQNAEGYVNIASARGTACRVYSKVIVTPRASNITACMGAVDVLDSIHAYLWLLSRWNVGPEASSA